MKAVTAFSSLFMDAYSKMLFLVVDTSTSLFSSFLARPLGELCRAI